MCGIVAYIGAKPAMPILLEGLRRLEYRGYDSCGLALMELAVDGRGSPAAEPAVGWRTSIQRMGLMLVVVLGGVSAVLWIGWYAFFTTRSLLKAPHMTFPHDGAVVSTNPTFKWSKVEGATRYELWVKNVTDERVYQPLRQKSVTATRFTPSRDLLTGKDYDAWMRACRESASSCGPWSKKKRLYMRAAPKTAPTLISPTGTITNPRPTFEWSTTPGANLYNLWIYNKTDQQLAFIAHDQSTPQYTVRYGLRRGVKYIAKAQGCSEKWRKSYRCGPWSKVRLFSIAP